MSSAQIALALLAIGLAIGLTPITLLMLRPKRFRRRSMQLFDAVSVVAFLATYIGGTAAAFIVANWVAIVILAYQVYGASAARRSARRAEANERNKYNAGLRDRSVSMLQAIPPWRVIYGECVTGGDIVAIFTSDKQARTKYGAVYTKPDCLKHLVIHVASHECEAFSDIFIDGVSLGTLNGSGYSTAAEWSGLFPTREEVTLAPGASHTFPAAVTVIQASYITGATPLDNTLVAGTYSLSAGDTVVTNTTAGQSLIVIVNYTEQKLWVRVQKHLGSDSQTVDTMLNALFPVEWDASHRLRGLCYVVMTIDLENPRFLGGPPNPTFEMKGKKLYDTRTATTAYSNNNALCINDFLVAPWGPGAVQANVNTSFANAAANACDAALNFFDWNNVGYGQSFDVAGNLQGWTAGGATIAVSGGALRVTSTGTDPVIGSPALSLPGTTWRGVRARIKRIAGSAWDGTCFYTTSGHGISGAFYKQIAEPTYGADGWAEVLFDMSALTAGGTDWTTSTITAIRLDLGNSSADIFDIDWVVISPLTEKAFTCNGVFTTDMSRESVLEDMCESMMGYAIYGADWRIVAGVWTASVMDLTDDDLDGMIEVIQSDTPLDQTFNGIRGVIIPRHKSSPVEFDSYVNPTWLANDGKPLWSNLSLSFTDSRSRARNLARIYMERCRNGQVLKYPAKLRAYPLQVGDRVRVSNTEYGLVNKYYRITDWNYARTAQVLLTLEEDDAAVYDLADAATVDPTPNTQLPNPWILAAPTTVAADSGTAQLVRLSDGTIVPRVRVTWDAYNGGPYVVDGAGRIVVTWRIFSRDSVGAVRTVVLGGTETGCYLQGVDDGDVVWVEVEARNGVGARSPSAFVVHTVVGKSAVPSNVASITATAIPGAVRLLWPAVADVDVLTYEVRRGASFAAGTKLDGTAGSTEVAGNTTDWLWPTPGTYTFWVKARDTTGHSSTTAASVSLTFTSTDIGVSNVNFRPNLLPNGGFESGKTGWTWFPPSGGDTSIVDNSVWGRTLVSTSVPNGVGSLVSERFPIQAGATYTISGDSLAIAGAVSQSYFDLIFYDAADAVVNDGGQSSISSSHDFDATSTNRNIHAVSAVAGAGAVWARARYVWDASTITAIGARLIKVERGGLPATAYSVEGGLIQALTNIASDDVLSGGEKSQAVLARNAIVNECPIILAAATNLKLSTTALTNAYNANTSYLAGLSPAWNDPTTNTPITGSAFRAAFTDYYAARDALQKLITSSSSVGLTLIARNTCTLMGSNAIKVSGSLWDSDVYSVDSFTGGAYASASPAQTNSEIMFGLNSDPLTDQNYTSLDYAFYFDTSGGVNAYESGTNVGTLASFASGDVLSIVYDNTNVRWSKNGVVLLTRNAPPGLTLFFDSSFATAGGVLKNIQFGPVTGTNIAGGNLIKNSSFEAFNTSFGSTRVADNWTIFSSGSTGLLTYYPNIGAGNYLFGSSSQEINCTALAAGARVGVRQIVQLPTSAGRPFVASMYFQATAGKTCVIQADFYDASNAFISAGVTQSIVATGGWQRVSGVMVAPTGTTYAALYCLLDSPSGPTNTTLRIDGAMFQPGELVTQFSPKEDEILQGAVGTIEIAPGAATDVLLDVAATPLTVAYLSAQIPISRALPAAGTYEITVTGRLTGSAAIPQAICYFSFSGAASSVGDGYPVYSVPSASTTVMISQSVTVTCTGAGPWTMQVLVNNESTSGQTLTYSELVMRSVFIKR